MQRNKPGFCRASMCWAAILVAGWLAWLTPALAVTFHVTSTADKVDINPGDGICDADPGSASECTLRAAIMEANALPNVPGTPPGYDQIGIYSGTYTLGIAGRDEDAAASGDLDITETVGIFGQTPNRPVIDGAGLDRVFDFLADGILNDVIVQGGSATGSGIHGTGGGARCFGGTVLYVLDTIVKNNSASEMGGGLHAENCQLVVGNSLVERNNVTGGGGGISSRFAPLVVSASSILDNHASPGSSGSSGGGGITTTAPDPADYTYIYQSTVAGNTADWGAGMTFGSRGYLIDSTITGNRGTYGGGAGLRTFNALDITASTIYCNQSTSTSYEAGVYLQGSSASVSIDNSILARNTNANGEAECNGPLVSGGYNLIGDTTACSVTGSTTGNQLNLDPLLAGPFPHPISAGTAGGRLAWLPRSMFGPTVDRGAPSGILYDNDADTSTPEVTLVKDQWNLTRPDDGDGDGTPRADVGAIESPVIMNDGFEIDAGACPAP